MEVLGIIPARGGSKGIPRKNLAPLGGRPLIAYTCDAARASRRLTRFVVSTDDEEIFEIARALVPETPLLRPPHLAADDTPMVDVLLDIVATLERRERYRPDAVVLLQPTSPFRRAEHVDAAVELLESSGADSVVTVIVVPHQFSPSSLMRQEGNRLVPAADGELRLRRQDKPRLFARNGPAVAAVRTSVLVDRGTLYGPDTRGLVMAREDSLDIDDPFDLDLAELLLAARAPRRIRWIDG
ncbi:MAG TPA: acylneuraminate cytidylyltransferase family protein [Vicinamibacterales bacterium]